MSQNKPQHVAVVLDGNGRWATQKGLKRSEGHRAGAEAVDRLLQSFLDQKIGFVSLYAFSTENWKRSSDEVSAIWKLLDEFFTRRLEFCLEKGIRIRVSGDRSRLPFTSQRIIEKAISRTAHMDRLVANFCVNYGSRDEITRAATRVNRKRLRALLRFQFHRAFSRITEKELERELYTEAIPDVDLLIRPGGEFRISNFLLWQSAYAEFYFTDTLWPDFTEGDLQNALDWFDSRERRFGGRREEQSE